MLQGGKRSDEWTIGRRYQAMDGEAEVSARIPLRLLPNVAAGKCIELELMNVAKELERRSQPATLRSQSA